MVIPYCGTNRFMRSAIRNNTYSNHFLQEFESNPAKIKIKSIFQHTCCSKEKCFPLSLIIASVPIIWAKKVNPAVLILCLCVPLFRYPAKKILPSQYGPRPVFSVSRKKDGTIFWFRLCCHDCPRIVQQFTPLSGTASRHSSEAASISSR